MHLFEKNYSGQQCATARIPTSAELGLEQAGVAVDAEGRIRVDSVFRTSAASVSPSATPPTARTCPPVAIREGHAFSDREFGKKEVHDLIPAVPPAVFSSPEIASVGLTDEEAWAHLPSLSVFQSDFKPMKHAFTQKDERFFAKLIVDRESDKVVGVHLMEAGAGELIQLAAVAMSAGTTKADSDLTLAVHPTIAEELVTMHAPARSKLAQGRS